jgi:DNA-binding NtrC family response regulator
MAKLFLPSRTWLTAGSRQGMWDYIQKGGSSKEFKFSLARALKYRQQKQPVIRENTFRNKMIVGQRHQSSLLTNTAEY